MRAIPFLAGNDRVAATPLDRGARESEPKRLINLPETPPSEWRRGWYVKVNNNLQFTVKHFAKLVRFQDIFQPRDAAGERLHGAGVGIFRSDGCCPVTALPALQRG